MKEIIQLIDKQQEIIRNLLVEMKNNENELVEIIQQLSVIQQLSDIRESKLDKREEKIGLRNEEHIDWFIYHNYRGDAYARFVLHPMRLPAVLKGQWAQYDPQYPLFCDHEQSSWRVIGASRLGDVWIAEDFQRTYGYDKRVQWKQCSNWRPTPNIKQLNILKHTLGLDLSLTTPVRRDSHRNNYVATVDSDNFSQCIQLEKLNLLYRGAAINDGRDTVFHATEKIRIILGIGRND